MAKLDKERLEHSLENARKERSELAELAEKAARKEFSEVLKHLGIEHEFSEIDGVNNYRNQWMLVLEDDSYLKVETLTDGVRKRITRYEGNYLGSPEIAHIDLYPNDWRDLCSIQHNKFLVLYTAKLFPEVK